MLHNESGRRIMTKFKWGLLAAFLVFLASVFDTQLIVLRDEGTFNLYYTI